jgi:hypothetical protein
MKCQIGGAYFITSEVRNWGIHVRWASAGCDEQGLDAMSNK